MMKLILSILFLVSSCSPIDKKESFNAKSFFFQDMSFEEFKIKLDEYAKNSHYPDLDNLNE